MDEPFSFNKLLSTPWIGTRECFEFTIKNHHTAFIESESMCYSGFDMYSDKSIETPGYKLNGIIKSGLDWSKTFLNNI